MANETVDRAIKEAGGPTALARALGIRVPSLYSWQQIPPKRVLDIERLTGIPRHELRPDIYPLDAAQP